QTVLTEDSWQRYGEFRELLAPFDFEFGFSLLHDGEGRIAIRGAHFAELLRQHELFPGMAFFRRHAAEMLVGDFRRPWKCLGGFKYLYVNPDGRAQYCSQVAGGGRPIEELTLADLRAAGVHEPCEARCAPGCVSPSQPARGDGTTRLLVAPSAVARLAAARAWLATYPRDAELVVVGASREACDELVRDDVREGGARFGLVRATLGRVAGALAAP